MKTKLVDYRSKNIVIELDFIYNHYPASKITIGDTNYTFMATEDSVMPDGSLVRVIEIYRGN